MPRPEVSVSGYYDWLSRPPSARAIRHAWLTDYIIEGVPAHPWRLRRSPGHAELRLGRGIMVGHGAVELLMRRAGLAGTTSRPKWRHTKPDTIAADLVDRKFSRTEPNQLWVADITEHPTREGSSTVAVVLDAYSRRVVGWSIDASPTATLVTNALNMAFQPAPHRPARSSTPTRAVRLLGVHPARQGLGAAASMGSVGDCYDNSMIEAFWSRIQVELLDQRCWRTRVELADAICEYLEIGRVSASVEKEDGRRFPMSPQLRRETHARACTSIACRADPRRDRPAVRRLVA
jgi:putative transposase